MEKIQTNDWEIINISQSKAPPENLVERHLDLRFIFKPRRNISEDDLIQLGKDLQDLGKWRKFKELKKDLEDRK